MKNNSRFRILLMAVVFMAMLSMLIVPASAYVGQASPSVNEISSGNLCVEAALLPARIELTK